VLEPYPPCNWGRLGIALFVLAEPFAHRTLNVAVRAVVSSRKADRAVFASQRGPRRRISKTAGWVLEESPILQAMASKIGPFIDGEP